MKVCWLGTPEQKIAACTVLLMAGICVIDLKNEFDMPHLHVEDPLMPTTSVVMSAPASNTVSVLTHFPLDWNTGP